MQLKIATLFLFLFITHSFSQNRQLSAESQVSVLTVGPGDMLNDAFGHNAFRIYDPTFGIDLTFGYGAYDFDEPNFYLKFAQGKLRYKMSLQYFDDFMEIYRFQDREVKEQILNLDQSEKQKLFDFLVDNYKPENRFYVYDFFYDNCATRIRDVLVKSSEGKIEFNNPEGFTSHTFRELIHQHVPQNTWGSFGIDLALGSVVDIEASSWEHMFLPKYINEFFASAETNGKSLIGDEQILHQSDKTYSPTPFFISPLFVFGLLAAFIIWISIRDIKRKKQSKWIDLGIFSITGLAGLIILLLWFATDHSTTAFNYNLLWAFPLNLLMIKEIMRPVFKPWFKRYIRFLLIILVLMSLHWLVGVQIYPLAMLVLLPALVIRYLALIKLS